MYRIGQVYDSYVLHLGSDGLCFVHPQKMLLDFEQYGEPLHETLQRQLMEIRYPVRAPRTSRDARDVRRQRGYVENVPIHRNINYMPEVGGDPMTYEEWLRGDNLEPLPACS